MADSGMFDDADDTPLSGHAAASAPNADLALLESLRPGRPVEAPAKPLQPHVQFAEAGDERGTAAQSLPQGEQDWPSIGAPVVRQPQWPKQSTAWGAKKPAAAAVPTADLTASAAPPAAVTTVPQQPSDDVPHTTKSSTPAAAVAAVAAASTPAATTVSDPAVSAQPTSETKTDEEGDARAAADVLLSDTDLESITMSQDNPFAARRPEGPAAQLLVADTAAFIKHCKLETLAPEIVTIREVVAEIRDKEARQRLQTLPFELKFREPSAEALAAVSSFAKKTGDLISLSAVDLRVLALTYMMEVERCGKDHLNTEPKKVELRGPGSVDKPCRYGAECTRKDCWFQHPSAEEIQKQREEEEAAKAQAAENAAAEDETASSTTAEDDDDDGWITPSNLQEATEAHRQQNAEKPEEAVAVACVTTDFAMQNVLLQMGLRVMSIDGMLIKRVKTFLLKCSTCFRVTHDTMRQFCPSCGHPTLFKVPYTVDKWGNAHYTPKAPKVNLRGTVFSIPLPKGGRHANNLILRDDQRERTHPKQSKDTFSAYNDGLADKHSPFLTVHKVNAKGGFKPQHAQTKIGHGRRNPNVSRRNKR